MTQAEQDSTSHGRLAENLLERAQKQLGLREIDFANTLTRMAQVHATLHLADTISAGQAQPEPEQFKIDRCTWCDGQFPESALNYSSGEPACFACHAVQNAPTNS